MCVVTLPLSFEMCILLDCAPFGKLGAPPAGETHSVKCSSFLQPGRVDRGSPRAGGDSVRCRGTNIRTPGGAGLLSPSWSLLLPSEAEEAVGSRSQLFPLISQRCEM